MAKRSQRLRRQRRIERMKTSEQEARMTKTIEDNSVILEQMKNMSSSFDDILQNFDNEDETNSEQIVTPEPSVEMRIQPYNEPTLIAPETPNFKKMTKKILLAYAKENNVDVKSSMTKAKIIKAIETTL